MTRIFRRTPFLGLFAALLLAGCGDDTPAPKPIALTRDAIGEYCNMIVADHPGPKAQVFEKGREKPLWFSSVRDAFAYLTLFGEAQRPIAVYVHDMGRAGDWKKPPSDGAWTKAKSAVYVIGSRKRGGMGARETVPFADRKRADAFVAEHGGRVVAYSDIPREYIIGDKNDYDTPGGESASAGKPAASKE